MPNRRAERISRRRAGKLAALIAIVATATVQVGTAQADIKSPGAHTPYTTDIDLHLVWQWNQEVFDEGIGLGMRAYFNVLDNGPVPTINNSLAVGLGADLTFSDGGCGPIDCDAFQVWVPFLVQWNFFFSESFSIFPEIGLALQYVNVDWGGENFADIPGINFDYGYDDDDLDVELVLWLGGRYMFSRSVGMSLRIGHPSLLLGLTLLF
ncbi:MAG: hypothetical protein OXR73_10100 [Myxococcales bacterium]|nr:hypothetical protein [Myxococcales bacterium]